MWIVGIEPSNSHINEYADKYKSHDSSAARIHVLLKDTRRKHIKISIRKQLDNSCFCVSFQIIDIISLKDLLRELLLNNMDFFLKIATCWVREIAQYVIALKE